MINRRNFLNTAAVFTTAVADMQAQAEKETSAVPQSLRNAVEFGNRFVLWQSPYGSVDPVVCPYRSPGRTATGIQALGPPVRALYRLYQATGEKKYKAAADRYATYLMNTLHDPPTPYGSRVTINGQSSYSLSAAWMYGKAFSPCYEWFCRMNPNEGAFDQKAYAMYEWLQRHRRPDSYFGVGYPAGQYPDAQFSCDLGEVGTGLMGFYSVTHYRPALDDALGLAKFFLTDYQEGSGKGVWSPELGVWLVGPWPGGGAEHFTDQQYNTSAWGWSALVDGEFLLRLREHTEDAALKSQIDDKCVKALRWCVDACQFDDGAHGMFGRDDKWVGQNAAAILLYLELKRQNAIPADVDREYRPRIVNAWKWLLAHTAPDTYPPDGYIRVTGRTSRKPPENLLWMMAWTVEALLEAPRTFGA